MKLPNNLSFIYIPARASLDSYNFIQKIIDNADNDKHVQNKRIVNTELNKDTYTLSGIFSLSLSTKKLNDLNINDNDDDIKIVEKIKNYFQNISTNNTNVIIKNTRKYKTQKGFECSGKILIDKPYVIYSDFYIKYTPETVDNYELSLNIMGEFFISYTPHYMYSYFEPTTPEDEYLIQKFTNEFLKTYKKYLDGIFKRYNTDATFTKEEEILKKIYDEKIKIIQGI